MCGRSPTSLWSPRYGSDGAPALAQRVSGWHLAADVRLRRALRDLGASQRKFERRTVLTL
jgi:hypothetical protein